MCSVCIQDTDFLAVQCDDTVCLSELLKDKISTGKCTQMLSMFDCVAYSNVEVVR
jgi:hypothetical protein